MKRLSLWIAALFMLVNFGAGTLFAEEIDIAVSPNTINLSADGEWVTVHADIPYHGVITASLKLNGVEVAWTKADNQQDLVAKFVVGSVKNIVSPPEATLELVGVVETSEGDLVPFFGSDTVKVVKVGKE